MEDRNSGKEDIKNEIDTLVKENTKPTKFLTQNIQEFGML